MKPVSRPEFSLKFCKQQYVTYNLISDRMTSNKTDSEATTCLHGNQNGSLSDPKSIVRESGCRVPNESSFGATRYTVPYDSIHCGSKNDPNEYISFKYVCLLIHCHSPPNNRFQRICIYKASQTIFKTTNQSFLTNYFSIIIGRLLCHIRSVFELLRHRMTV